ncbi:MAG: hypothetical protein JNK10_05075 [Cyclobacteriaceae bacterium]|nr:hypothetical protein [Cyclobacteriaceae bacterium]
MKKLVYVVIAAILFVSPLSCKKDDPDPSTTLATTAEADAAEDSKSGGVYKGTLIGSSGIIKIVLQKGVKQIEITLDGVKKTLTTTSLDSWTSGEEIVDAEFTKDDWTVTFSMDENGETGGIGFNIPGHPNIISVIIKEKSNAQVKAYEGTYAGDDTGTWNFIEKGGLIYGASKSSDSSNGSGTFTGALVGTTINIELVGSSAEVTGTVNGNTVSGTWVVAADNKGTWTGTRTL